MAVNKKSPAPIWADPPPGTRRPRFSREQIAEVALAIADRDGFAAVSMRRIAEELGAATMTLYYYVRTKDDLVALMDDALMGEVLVSDEELAQGWREAITAIAYRSAAAFARHPWAMQELKGARVGPNGMRHVEQSLAAVADCPLDDRSKFELLGIVDDFVFGHAIRAQNGWSGPADDDKGRAMQAFMAEQMKSGDYPHLTRVFGNLDPFGESERTMATMASDRAFARGLAAILDAVPGWAATPEPEPEPARKPVAAAGDTAKRGKRKKPAR